jgi:4-pyridoxolactonase
VRVFLLDTGRMTIDRSQVLWNVDCGVRLRFPIYAVLIDHPEGLFLFDTGIDADHVRATFPWEDVEQSSEQGIVQQLASCGYAPGDVTYVVNSHLHFDHVGGNRFFGEATTLVSKDELRQAKVPEQFERLAYSDQSFDHPGMRCELLEGDVELARGLTLFETPGHSAGHYSLLVHGEAGQRKMLFTFDAAYTLENLDREIISGFHLDPVAATKSIKRLKKLARDHDATIFVAHDLEAFDGYKRAPESYAVATVHDAAVARPSAAETGIR